jgi:hypothetical protein
LRDRLTEREIDAYRHPLVRVGLDTYEAAGGGIRRDLFAEGDAGVYLTDAALLERLAQDKLAGIAAEVKAEGWAWVDATPGVTHADLHAFQRAPRSAANRTSAKRSASRSCKPRCTNWPKPWMPLGRRRRGKGRCLAGGRRSRGRAVAGAGRWLAGLRREREGRSRCHRHHRPQRRGRDSSRPDARSRGQGAAHAGTPAPGFGSEGERRRRRTETTTSSPRPPPCPTGWRSG